MKFIQVDNPKVLAFTRSYMDEHILVVVNLSKYSQAAEIDLKDFAGRIPVEVFSKNHFPAIKDHPYFFTLGPHSFHWFELSSADSESMHPDSLPEIQVNAITSLLDGAQRAFFETNILPSYLQRSDWFPGKKRKIFEVIIRQHETIHLPVSNAYLLLIEVIFEDGLPETYHLPVTIVKGDLERKLRETCPQAFMAICNAGSGCGMITDAFYTPELQQWLFKNLAANSVINLEQSVMHFIANDSLQKHVNENPEIISRVHSTDFKNTSITYDNTFFLKMYRKMDAGINPDVEITRHLTEDTNFSYVPAYLGSIEWMLEKETLSLGMMQVMVENHGDGKSFMTERVHNYIERILALNHDHEFQIEGSFTNPVSYDKIPTKLQNLMGGAASEHAALLGKRIAQLHQTLAQDSGKPAFQPEDFSLHYQRSLFSAMQSLVRESFQVIHKRMDKVEPEFQQKLKSWNTRKEEILTSLRRIYAKKIDALKTRIHGNLHLDQVLLTGRDIAIHDFGGDPYRHFSERRLKRSPLRDIASMIRSFYYVAYETILASSQIPPEEKPKIVAYAPLWGHYMSNFFLYAYYEGIKGKSILPDSEEDLAVMLDNYVIQKALLALNGELMNRPDHVIIPLKLLEIAMGKIQER